MIDLLPVLEFTIAKRFNEYAFTQLDGLAFCATMFIVEKKNGLLLILQVPFNYIYSNYIQLGDEFVKTT